MEISDSAPPGSMAGPPDRARIKDMLSVLSRAYSPAMQAEAFDCPASDIFRISHLYRYNGVLVDLGGGLSPHNGILARLGMTVHVVDLLSDYWDHRDWCHGVTTGKSAAQDFQLLESCGVKFIRADVSTFDCRAHFADNSVDIVTSFHCLEHLHQGPKIPMESAMQVLKPGGKLIIEVPNAANLRKRLALLRGHTNYIPYNWYYYSSPYRHHVRECTVGDLRQLAQNVGATEYRIFGKNFIMGERIQHFLQRIPARLRRSLDLALQCFPGLCSSIILEAVKSEEASKQAS